MAPMRSPASVRTNVSLRPGGSQVRNVQRSDLGTYLGMPRQKPNGCVDRSDGALHYKMPTDPARQTVQPLPRASSQGHTLTNTGVMP